jgi:MoxR-like ATPase
VQPDTALQLATSQLKNVRDEIGKIIVGQQDVVDGVLICLLAGDTCYVEGRARAGQDHAAADALPRAAPAIFANPVHPDLMPRRYRRQHDHRYEGGSKTLRFQHGPIFAHLVLADEINRATPKTQSALLEAMQEQTVTSGTQTMQLESPFLVMATQNPIEMEGTYPLPEAQLDRFLMKILVRYPSRSDLNAIVERTIHKDEIELKRCSTGTPSWVCGKCVIRY